jgi:hypothetical protein
MVENVFPSPKIVHRSSIAARNPGSAAGLTGTLEEEPNLDGTVFRSTDFRFGPLMACDARQASARERKARWFCCILQDPDAFESRFSPRKRLLRWLR